MSIFTIFSQALMNVEKLLNKASTQLAFIIFRILLAWGRAKRCTGRVRYKVLQGLVQEVTGSGIRCGRV